MKVKKMSRSESLDHDSWLIHSYPGYNDDHVRGHYKDVPAVIDFTGNHDASKVNAIVLKARNPSMFAPIDDILPHFCEFMAVEMLDGGYEDESPLRLMTDEGYDDELGLPDLYAQDNLIQAIKDYVSIFTPAIEDDIYADFLKEKGIEPPTNEVAVKSLDAVADFINKVTGNTEKEFYDKFDFAEGGKFDWDWDKYFDPYVNDGPD